MQHIYGDAEHWATANIIVIDPFKKRAMLSGIEVHRKYRGHGYGSAMLKRVLADADAEGYTLVLGVSPDESPESLDANALIAWYERNGFALIGDRRRRIMERPPSSGASTEPSQSAIL